MNDTITISREDYDQLVKDQHFLNCLEGMGVANWDWYDDAVALYEEITEELGG